MPVNDILTSSPAADTSSAGCEPEGFPATTKGAISLLQRGTCPFVQKLANAQAAGAVGAILMNEGDSPGRMNAGFRAGPPDLAIPGVFSSFAVGQELLSLSHGALWRGRGGPDRTKGRGFASKARGP